MDRPRRSTEAQSAAQPSQKRGDASFLTACGERPGWAAPCPAVRRPTTFYPAGLLLAGKSGRILSDKQTAMGFACGTIRIMTEGAG